MVNIVIVSICLALVIATACTTTHSFKIKNNNIAYVRVENNSFTMVDLCIMRNNNITRLETINPTQNTTISIPLSLAEGNGEITFCLRPFGDRTDLSAMWFADPVVIDKGSMVIITIEPSYHDNLQETYIRVLPEQ